jgi:uncharacterized membrane protein YeaQ/YmgE (transglycosylase-associated protein family)
LLVFAYTRPAPDVGRLTQARDIMGIIAWILLGLVAGFIASKIVSGSGAGTVVDIVLGVVGAVVGGLIFHLAGASGVTGLNIWSLVVAVLGAVIVLGVYHAFAGRRLRA